MLNDKNKNSFCPGHWNDLYFAPSQGYSYACCKSKPIDILEPEEFEKRRENSLNGIRDEGCSYCWEIEDSGQESLRQYKIRLAKEWHDNVKATLVLGNLCNFQCTYCNAKYSSRWQTDEKLNGRIKLKYDSSVYYDGVECENKPAEVFLEYLDKNPQITSLFISGGEPFMGDVLYEILSNADLSNIKKIFVSSNLSFPNTKTLDKFLSFADGRVLGINPSLDTVNPNVQEYIRYGFDWKIFNKNLNFLFTQTPVRIHFNSLITAHTIFGIDKLYEFIYALKEDYLERINWFMSPCVQPRICSFEILKEEEKEMAIPKLEKIKLEIEKLLPKSTLRYKFDKEYMQINTLISILQNTKFNHEVRKDQQNFFKQFNERHNITTPKELEFLIKEK